MALQNFVMDGSGNGLSYVRYQPITWANADLLYNKPKRTIFSEICIKIWNSVLTWLNKMHLKIATFFFCGLTLISAWISNYMPNKMWEEIVHSQTSTLYWEGNWLSMLGLKLIDVNVSQISFVTNTI